MTSCKKSLVHVMDVRVHTSGWVPLQPAALNFLHPYDPFRLSGLHVPASTLGRKSYLLSACPQVSIYILENTCEY